MSENGSPENLLEFPCHYQFKAVGIAGNSFKISIIAAIEQHAAVSMDSVRSRPSGKGKYQAVSVLATLHNYEQLTNIYANMKQVEGLKLLL